VSGVCDEVSTMEVADSNVCKREGIKDELSNAFTPSELPTTNEYIEQQRRCSE
jgi:hypothetical protein